MRTVIQLLLIVLLTAGLVVGLSFLTADSGASAPQTETAAPAYPRTEPVTAPTESPETVPQEAAQKFDTVPRYYQTDYPYEPFSEGTVISSGCSVTCLAMVASYLTDHEYTPAQMAYHFNIYGLDNVQRLEYANEKMQLPAVKMDDARKLIDALKAGKVAIMMVNDQSIFTTTGHFVVLAGITGEERIIINDPYQMIWAEDTYMSDRYRDGFERHHIFQGFMGAWVYDKKDMPPEPYLYPADLPQQPENRYQGYRLSEEEEQILESFLWAEALNESQQVRQAIAEVILNRVVSQDFPYSVKNVIYKGEYAHRIPRMKRAETAEDIHDAVQAAMYGPYLLPEDVFYFSQWEKGGEVWGTIDSYTFCYSRRK